MSVGAARAALLGSVDSLPPGIYGAWSAEPMALGKSVRSFPDISGNGKDFPAANLSVINNKIMGHRALSQNDGDGVSTQTINPIINGAWTIGIVMNVVAYGSRTVAVGMTTTAGGSVTGYIYDDGELILGGAQVFSPVAATGPATAVYRFIPQAGGFGTPQGWTRKVLGYAQESSNNTNTTGIANFSCYGTSTSILGSVYLYPRALSDNEILSLESTMKARYDLP